MTLTIAQIDSGRASLGRWGSIRLEGRQEAMVKASTCEDFAVPPEAAEDLPRGVAVLADDIGRLLLLPYSGAVIACLDLAGGGLAYPMISLVRVADEGLRMASVRLLDEWGVLHLTETSLCLFDQRLSLLWRRDADFLGWSFEGVTGREVLLLASDWTGGESRQVFSLVDGRSVS